MYALSHEKQVAKVRVISRPDFVGDISHRFHRPEARLPTSLFATENNGLFLFTVAHARFCETIVDQKFF
jgi:hypothetical protein